MTEYYEKKEVLVKKGINNSREFSDTTIVILYVVTITILFIVLFSIFQSVQERDYTILNNTYLKKIMMSLIFAILLSLGVIAFLMLLYETHDGKPAVYKTVYIKKRGRI